MKVTRGAFRKWMNQLDEKVIDKDSMRDKEYVVPVLFCSLQYTKYGQYLPADEVPEV